MHSQLQDEHHICAALVHVVQCDDVGVQQLSQDPHLSLNFFPAHTPPAGPALSFLDELGCILLSGTLLPAFLHYGKLATVGTQTCMIRETA